MRLTDEGQVTIPADMRDRLGLRPGDEVDVVVDGDAVVIRRSVPAPRSGRSIVERLRHRGDVPLDTDEIMKLTRGE